MKIKKLSLSIWYRQKMKNKANPQHSCNIPKIGGKLRTGNENQTINFILQKIFFGLFSG